MSPDYYDSVANSINDDSDPMSNFDPQSAMSSGSNFDGQSGSNFDAQNPSPASNIFPIPYADLTNPQSLNLYGYVLNNPLSKNDPDGHDTCKDGTRADVCVVADPPPPLPPPNLNSYLLIIPKMNQPFVPQSIMLSQRGSGNKGERGTAAKPSGTKNPGKKVRPSKTHPGRLEVQNPHTGKWDLKPPGWSPYVGMQDAEGEMTLGEIFEALFGLDEAFGGP
jgi:hypothetical protein